MPSSPRGEIILIFFLSLSSAGFLHHSPVWTYGLVVAIFLESHHHVLGTVPVLLVGHILPVLLIGALVHGGQSVKGLPCLVVGGDPEHVPEQLFTVLVIQDLLVII